MPQTFIRNVQLSSDDVGSDFPFSLPCVKHIDQIKFEKPITFLVGENGSGKSTIIEAIAVAAGFSPEGGTKNYHYETHNSTSDLHKHITLVRNARREKTGYFLRAESFYTTANYAEKGTYTLSGPSPILFKGKGIHAHSHGEAFMAIIENFSGNGLYLFDEPESALSPKRILALMALLYRIAEAGAQCIIATHSPILLALPGTIYELTEEGIHTSSYHELEHVQITRDFLQHPEVFLHHIKK